MKTGKTLVELAQELDRQAREKVDLVASTAAMDFHTEDKKSSLIIPDVYGTERNYTVNSIAHGQIAERLGIPYRYYEKMRETQPELLDRNVNTWLKAEPERRMVRTLDGFARAFLSDRYRRLDNYDLMQEILPTLVRTPGVQLVSCEVTDTRLYLKVVNQRLEGEVKKGDIVQAGLVISNSEVGMGAVSVMPLLYRLVCTNGAIMNLFGERRAHLGRKVRGDELDPNVLFSERTLALDDKAFFAKVTDIAMAAFEPERFNNLLERVRLSTERRIDGDPVKATEVLAQKMRFNDGERGGILSELIRGADMTQWGLANAVTAFSKGVENYDRATELEKAGGDIITLPESEWRIISKPAA